MNSDSVNTGRFWFSGNDLWLRVAENEKTTQPVQTRAPEFSTANDSLITSEKAGKWVSLLADTLGKKDFDKNMLDYFSRWQFKHPYPEDFELAMDTNGLNKLLPLNANLSLFDNKFFSFFFNITS